MNSLKYYTFVVGILIGLSIAPFIINNEVSTSEKYIYIEYVWERAGVSTCRYDLQIHGFLSPKTSEPTVKTVYLVDKCGVFSKGDILKLKH